ncbi:MAG: pilus assembly protein [Acidobacteria bacterium]|nr:MAG: pilus assembly protein [Acidobacteriota bacterium]
MRTLRNPEQRHNPKSLPARLLNAVSAIASRFSRHVSETDGAELLEFALALPMILVMVAGLLDFARAYNIKQKLANAVREGARYQSTETADITLSNPASVQTLRDDVVNYLTNAGLDTSFIGTALTYNPAPGVCTGTYYTTTGTSSVNYGLEVERCVPVVDASGVSIQSTRVTLYYPYDWTFGFNNIIKLMLPSSTFSNPIRIQTDATISNFS